MLAAEINALLAETLDILRRLEEKERRAAGGGGGIGGGGGEGGDETPSSEGMGGGSLSSSASPSSSSAAFARHRHPRLRTSETKLYAYILKSDEVSYLSSLTLAYRALPPVGARSRTFADECIDAARASMRSHDETMNMVEDQALKIGHLHW